MLSGEEVDETELAGFYVLYIIMMCFPTEC